MSHTTCDFPQQTFAGSCFSFPNPPPPEALFASQSRESLTKHNFLSGLAAVTKHSSIVVVVVRCRWQLLRTAVYYARYTIPVVVERKRGGERERHSVFPKSSKSKREEGGRGGEGRVRVGGRVGPPLHTIREKSGRVGILLYGGRVGLPSSRGRGRERERERGWAAAAEATAAGERKIIAPRASLPPSLPHFPHSSFLLLQCTYVHGRLSEALYPFSLLSGGSRRAEWKLMRE